MTDEQALRCAAERRGLTLSRSGDLYALTKDGKRMTRHRWPDGDVFFWQQMRSGAPTHVLPLEAVKELLEGPYLL